MLLALEFPDGGKGGRGKKNCLESEQFSRALMSQARLINAHAPDMAAAVISGATRFADISRNIQTREMSASQKAMLLALEFPDASSKAHRGKASETTKLLQNQSFSPALMTKARLINAHAPDMAAAFAKRAGQDYLCRMAGKAGRSGRPTKDDQERTRAAAREKAAQLAEMLVGPLREPQDLDMPEYFNADERALFWKLWLSLPQSAGTMIDQGLVEMAVTAWQQSREASAIVRRSGLLIRDADGNARRNPALIVQQRAATTFAALASRLGLSAAQRARLVAAQDEPVDGIEILERLDYGRSPPNGGH